MKSRRATPQLTLPLTMAPVDAKTSTAERHTFFDPSPFDPTEFDQEFEPARTTAGRASERVGREPPAALRDPELPVRPARVVDAIPLRAATPKIHAASPERAHSLASELRVLVGSPLRLHVHDNRSTMVSFRRDRDVLHMRLHHMFLEAGPDVVRALADYARARSVRAGKVLDQYVRQNRSAIKPVDIEEARTRPLRTAGEEYDLEEIYRTLNARYFDNQVTARIGWGRGTPNRRRRSIRMGAYYHDTQTILIHPALDRAEIPRYFVELVVYHEMLHEAVPQQRSSTGRRCIHSPEFRAREREFHDFDRARTWERRNLAVLLRPSRTRS